MFVYLNESAHTSVRNVNKLSRQTWNEDENPVRVYINPLGGKYGARVEDYIRSDCLFLQKQISCFLYERKETAMIGSFFKKGHASSNHPDLNVVIGTRWG